MGRVLVAVVALVCACGPGNVAPVPAPELPAPPVNVPVNVPVHLATSVPLPATSAPLPLATLPGAPGVTLAPLPIPPPPLERPIATALPTIAVPTLPAATVPPLPRP